MNAVIYARYSSEGQREESIDGQIRECMEYCKQNGMTVVKEYIDRALSAKTDNRPDFQRMIKDSAKGLFDVVVVWKLDRFARNRYDSAHYKATLKKNGVRVISAKENIADGPEGIILESMLEGMAEYYSAELSVKVIRGHTENALKCKYNGGTPTFGFAIDANKQYQPDPVNAPIVLDIFKMYDTGSTMKQIVDHLNALGVTTVRGKPADLNFISGILHNRKYIGEYKYRDIVVPDGIPALVPTDLFERVQEQMKKNKKAPARHKAEDDYLLTTKLFCGSCKAMMVGESGTSSSKGQVYHYYRCVNSKRKKTCEAKHRSVRKDPLERAVVASVMRNIMDDAFVEYFTDQALALQGQESNELPALRRQLADTEKAIDNMLNAIQAGIFNASTKRRLDELEATKEKLELSIIKEEMKKPQFTREQIQFYILQFRKVDTNTLEGRRRLIDGFVNSVVVYDDYILVTFNYKEGAERITFEQIERSDLSSLGGPIGVSRFGRSDFFWFLKRCFNRARTGGRLLLLPFSQESDIIFIKGDRWQCFAQKGAAAMTEAIVNLIVNFLLGLIFTSIGIYAAGRKDPMWFWSGSTVSPQEIRDIPAYNRANGLMWCLYAIPFYLAGILYFCSPQLGIALILLVVFPGIPVLIWNYYRIRKTYHR